MSERHPNLVNAHELAWIDLADPGGRKFGTRAKPLAFPAGAARLGCTLYELPPGKRSCPFHYHLANEEAIYILDGEATLRLGDREISVRAGDYIAFPVGPDHPHQLINRSGAAVHYLCMSTLQTPEVAV
ncbi:MAG TPA: cupin domain-containing protein, partial [Kofleriaceae bacterium]